MSSRLKPDFIYVGGTRSAGAYITKVLSSHPEIFIGNGAGSIAEKNDLNFFNKDLTDPYFRQFEGHDGKVLGESKRNYYLYRKTSSGKSVVNKIVEMNPDIKIIISLRNPIHRVFSHYYKLFAQNKMGRILDSPGGLIKDYDLLMTHKPTSGYYSISRVITDSFYHEHVKNYLEVLPRNNVKFIIHYDEIWFKEWHKAEPEITFKEIYSFLGVDENFVSPVLKSQFNTLSMQIKGRSSPLIILFRLFNKFNLFSLSRRLFSYVPSSPVIDEQTYNFLLEIFIDDIIKLETLLGINLSSWKEYN